jgi:hypothetical protein
LKQVIVRMGISHRLQVRLLVRSARPATINLEFLLATITIYVTSRLMRLLVPRRAALVPQRRCWVPVCVL